MVQSRVRRPDAAYPHHHERTLAETYTCIRFRLKLILQGIVFLPEH